VWNMIRVVWGMKSVCEIRGFISRLEKSSWLSTKEAVRTIDHNGDMCTKKNANKEENFSNGSQKIHMTNSVGRDSLTTSRRMTTSERGIVGPRACPPPPPGPWPGPGPMVTWDTSSARSLETEAPDSSTRAEAPEGPGGRRGAERRGLRGVGGWTRNQAVGP